MITITSIQENFKTIKIAKGIYVSKLTRNNEIIMLRTFKYDSFNDYYDLTDNESDFKDVTIEIYDTSNFRCVQTQAFNYYNDISLDLPIFRGFKYNPNTDIDKLIKSGSYISEIKYGTIPAISQ